MTTNYSDIIKLIKQQNKKIMEKIDKKRASLPENLSAERIVELEEEKKAMKIMIKGMKLRNRIKQ